MHEPDTARRGVTGGRRPLVLAVLVVALVGGTVAAVAVGGATVGATPPPDGYALVQGDRCVDVAPVTGGQPVESAYDYRNPYPNRTGNPSAGDYSAHGFRRYQSARRSSLFVYRGPRGDSLVMLHGALDGRTGGSTVTFEFDNLPAGGRWAVQDDDYPNMDDSWDVGGSAASVDWVWEAGRTDGGAFRGLDAASEPVVVRPRFNERAPRWGEWRHSGSPENRIRSWRAFGGDGRTVGLDMGRPLLVAPGRCADLTLPAPSLDASTRDVPRNRPVRFTASPGGGLPASEYRWDFDGDGTVDRVTDGPSTEYRYPEAGTYTATVRTAAGAGTSAPATVTVRVGQSDSPAIGVTGIDAGAAVAGEPSPVRVTLVNDGGGEGSIRVDVVADGETVGSRSVGVGALSSRTVPVEATFPDPGTYTVEVGGARTEVDVAEANPELAVRSLAVDDPVPVDQPFTVTATVENVGNADHEFDVRLGLFGEVVDSKSVAVPDGERRTVEFEVTVSAPGTYTARVGDQSAEVVVREAGAVTEETTTTPADGGSPGFGLSGGAVAVVAAAVLAGLLAVARSRGRR